ncbi:TrmH family RNA methyltransferase [Hydrogenimonas urashimensis]|uniref:TrmH family RNA methyltransferase n=1 Tax=Hydrogenimonas urashimensis TaxID=2740515 RepID=UPI0019163854|nr:RNA methyltransferase [Hydrogenimonas urashimensis]
MKIHHLETLDLPELALYRTLRSNRFDKKGGFVADSPRVVEQLLESGLEFCSLLCTPDYFEKERSRIEAAGVPVVYLAERGLLEKIVGHKIHHNVMAHAIRPDNIALRELPDRIVMLSRLNNMENVGAIARNAAALGVGGYVVPAAGPHPYGRRAIRVSTGHVTRLRIHCYDDAIATMERLRDLGYTLLAAETSANATPLSQYASPPLRWVLILGNEEEGVPSAMLERCDALLRIEMEPDVRSFNVATAGAIVMYRLRYG